MNPKLKKNILTLFWSLKILTTCAYGSSPPVTTLAPETSSTVISPGRTLPSKRLVFRAFVLRHGQTDANAAKIIQGSSDFSRLTSLGKIQAAEVLNAFRNTEGDNKKTAVTTSNIISSIYCSPLTRAQDTLKIFFEKDLEASEKYRDKKYQRIIPFGLCEIESGNSNKLSPNVVVLPDLREIDFYDWEGETKENLRKKFPDEVRAFEAGEPQGMRVFETQKNEDDCEITPTISEKESHLVEHYPLLELWDRADAVWDDIFEREKIQEACLQQPFNEMSSEQSNLYNREILIMAHGTLGQALLGAAMGWGAEEFRKHKFANCGLVEIEWEIPVGTSINPSAEAGSIWRRPLAVRWRWRWPEPSNEWKFRELL